MKQRITLLFTLILCCILLPDGSAQTRKQYLKAAEESFEQKNYYAALKYYEEALEFDSLQMDVWYRYGLAAARFNAFSLAEKALQLVIDSADITRYPEIRFQMGEVQKSLGKYSEALGQFQEFLADTLTAGSPLAPEARKEIEACEWSLEVVSNPDTNVVIERLPETINTPFSEFGATWVADSLFFTSFSFINEQDKHDPPRQYNKVLVSEDGEIGQFWDNINSASRHTAHTAFTPDRQQVFFTYCDYVSEGEIRCELYFRQKDSLGGWAAPVKLPEYINLEGFTASEPMVARDEEMKQLLLFFSSDRPGGKGGMDIWYSVLSADGTISHPVNLGDSINSEGNDITPYYHTPTQTLFFSNDSRMGLGNHDIFSAVKEGEGWSAPKHMGYPLNSSYDDIHYKLSPGGAFALYSSNRLGSTYIEKEKEACCHDIYRLNTLKLEFRALTFDEWTRKPLSGVTVTLEKLDGTGPSLSQLNEEGNEFDLMPRRGEIYILRAERPGYHPYTDTLYLDRSPLNDLLSYTHEIYMEPAEVMLNVLTFDDYTKLGLVGTTVEIYDITDPVPSLVGEKTNANGNDFSFKLDPGRKFVIKATKSGYENVLDTISTGGPDIRANKVINRELFLPPIIFAQFLPITLYFDNDHPNPDSWDTTTNYTYLQTWDRYYGRKQEFVRNFTAGMNPQMQSFAERRLEGFFEEEVKKGGEALRVFSDLLYEFLKQGNRLQIVLKGYASPRYESDYNENLSKRRISSVRNYFDTYRNGIFQPFLEDGSLTIRERPYGESKANPEVSAEMKDVRNSIYGVPASHERRVEIIDVKETDEFID